MTFKELKLKIKEEQKDLALEIRRGKYLRKPVNRTDITKDDKHLYYYGGEFQAWKIEILSNNYRHKHIMYCQMFNNTPYELIEQPRNGNKANSHDLDFYKKQWSELLDETVCDSA